MKFDALIFAYVRVSEAMTREAASEFYLKLKLVILNKGQ